MLFDKKNAVTVKAGLLIEEYINKLKKNNKYELKEALIHFFTIEKFSTDKQKIVLWTPYIQIKEKDSLFDGRYFTFYNLLEFVDFFRYGNKTDEDVKREYNELVGELFKYEKIPEHFFMAESPFSVRGHYPYVIAKEFPYFIHTKNFYENFFVENLDTFISFYFVKKTNLKFWNYLYIKNFFEKDLYTDEIRVGNFFEKTLLKHLSLIKENKFLMHINKEKYERLRELFIKLLHKDNPLVKENIINGFYIQGGFFILEERYALLTGKKDELYREIKKEADKHNIKYIYKNLFKPVLNSFAEKITLKEMSKYADFTNPSKDYIFGPGSEVPLSLVDYRDFKTIELCGILSSSGIYKEMLPGKKIKNIEIRGTK